MLFTADYFIGIVQLCSCLLLITSKSIGLKYLLYLQAEQLALASTHTDGRTRLLSVEK